MPLTVTFVSNYINHHQIPFCEAMRKRLGDGFAFVQMEEMEEERKKMGWEDHSEELCWVLKWSEDRKEAEREMMSCDLLIAGWVPEIQDLLVKRLNIHRPVFQISERIYKDGQWKAISPKGLLHKYRAFTKFRREPYFLLCAGAYVASDYGLIGAFPEKKYRWGYFPPMISYEGDRPPIRRRQAADPAELVWAGRFVAFKHVERVLELADRLERDGKNFLLHIIGGDSAENGGEEEKAHRYVLEHGLEEKVIFHGLCSTETVRDVMEHSDIFVFTSDHGEGWGAVLNEAMNSGCAPVAGAEAGAVPYLLRNGVNGYIYADGDQEDLAAKTERLIDDPELCERFAEASFRSVVTLWNAETAAERLLLFADKVLDACEERRILLAGGARRTALEMKNLNADLPAEGPMSRAPGLRPFLHVPRMAETKQL